jgi:NAD(P)-dependent dehydrogenase (short-subunit alcohol dehydrogenase family)
VRLENRSIIVTGGARGIGLVIARTLLDRGARVTIGATSQASLDEANEGLGPSDRLASVAADLRFPEGGQTVAAGARNAFGTIDALVANAGLYDQGSADAMTEERWDRVIDTNLKSTFFSIQAALPALRHAGGAVVVISSYNGVAGARGDVSAYGAAKAGLINLTRALALDLAPDIRVNAIAPGYVETEKLLALDGAEEIIEALSRETPLGRLVRREEIAHAVVFALENEALTGTTINIDGGRSA